MRITNTMTNRVAKEAGLPIYSSSALLEELQNGSKASWKEDFSSTGVNNLMENRYEDLEKEAEQLGAAAENFTGENMQDFVDCFNKVMDSLKGTPSSLNDYYRQMLKETAEESTDALEKLGITMSGSGKLSFDASAQSKLDEEQRKEALEAAKLFTGKVAFLAGRVANNAQVNAASASSQYDASGNAFMDFTNKYNFWG